ncbi:19R [Xanthomonas phage Xp10]|uniref:19R n=1 Tax=Xanthomonas phage Xp10 TaxID=2907956 RepID=Q7Y5J8_9CAUD|nr:virion structural protein [Xanthomonas phage Xp10]AAP58686.1 19R [Xanthomonas phage Xp10]
MSELPSYCQLLVEGYSEEYDPAIERSEMERGLAKQRIKNTYGLMRFTVRALIQGQANIDAFDSWYLDDIRRIGFFTMVQPRTRQTINARFVEGKIGAITVLKPGLVIRDLNIEYLRTS